MVNATYCDSVNNFFASIHGIEAPGTLGYMDRCGASYDVRFPVSFTSRNR